MYVPGPYMYGPAIPEGRPGGAPLYVLPQTYHPHQQQFAVAQGGSTGESAEDEVQSPDGEGMTAMAPPGGFIPYGVPNGFVPEYVPGYMTHPQGAPPPMQFGGSDQPLGTGGRFTEKHFPPEQGE